MESQLVFQTPTKEDRLSENHQCKVNKRMYSRAQPYDMSPPSMSRSSTGSPPSSPDQNCAEESSGVAGGVHKERKHRRELANKRERTRMHTVNSAFDHLRQLVPTYPSNRKLSKIETLRLACSYIQDLTKLVNDNNIQSMQGEDVNMLYSRSDQGFGAGYSTSSHVAQPPSHGYLNPMSSKNEYTTPPEFTTQSYCYQPSSVGYVNSDAESCLSESDVPSPTHGQQPHYSMYPGIAVRPPPAISRVNSDGTGSVIAMQMANASIGSNSPTYCSSPSAGAPCSPLTRAQHSTSSISHGQITTLQCNPNPLSSLQAPSFSSIHHTPIFPQCYSQ